MTLVCLCKRLDLQFVSRKGECGGPTNQRHIRNGRLRGLLDDQWGHFLVGGLDLSPGHGGSGSGQDQNQAEAQAQRQKFGHVDGLTAGSQSKTLTQSHRHAHSHTRTHSEQANRSTVIVDR